MKRVVEVARPFSGSSVEPDKGRRPARENPQVPGSHGSLLRGDSKPRSSRNGRANVDSDRSIRDARRRSFHGDRDEIKASATQSRKKTAPGSGVTAAAAAATVVMAIGRREVEDEKERRDGERRRARPNDGDERTEKKKSKSRR